MNNEKFNPLVLTSKDETSKEFNRRIRKRIIEALGETMENTEYSEEERIMAAKCYSDVLYWIVLEEERNDA